MREGRHWLCSWRRDNDRYEAWVDSRPAIRATGRTWQQTLEDLSAAVCDATGDGEPQFRFDPPEPCEGSERDWIDPRWCQVAANGYFPLCDQRDELFTQGICCWCNSARGDRTDVPLRGQGTIEGDFCAAWYVLWPYSPLLLSERAMNLFTEAELAVFRVIPVERDRSARARVFELVPRRFVRTVAICDWTVSGTRCPECGRERFSCTLDSQIDYNSGQLHDFCCTSDLPSDQDLPLALGDLSTWCLLMPIPRAREMCRHKHARGSRVCPLGTVPTSMVDPRPKLSVASQIVLPPTG